jgi:2-polyprenyl-3-methyl-5-hydroxy-6-metoxy-1,4-benzoquinol methylase
LSTIEVSEPAPTRCPACGGAMAPWLWAVPQEAGIRARYLLVRCGACGSASTAGPPPDERGDLYETGTYEGAPPRGEAVIEAMRAAYERQKLRILSAAGVRPPARLIDAGAGQGRFVLAARRRGYDAIGFEPSRRGVEIAARRGVTLQAATLDHAEVAEASADAVSCWHVLEHLAEPGAALDRIAAWLRPSAALLLGVPNLASLQAAIAGGRWLHLDVPRHRHHFTPAGIGRLLDRHGFTVIRSHQVLIEHNPFGMWQSWLDRFTSSPAYAYNLVKRNVAPNPRDLAITATLGVLAPLAVALELVAGLAGRGGTMAIVARRR